jgi:hypothetical protein
MPFIAENELERALAKAVRNPASAPDFYRLLLQADLLVLGTVEGREDAQAEFTPSAGSRFNLVPGMRDGSPFLPVFSSLARMQEYVKEESKFLRVNGRALLDLTRGAPVILNPASEYGKALTPDEITILLDGAMPDGAPRTIIGEADFPVALRDALIAVFKTRPDITAAWMIQVTFADRAQEPHPLVGIETTGDWPSLIMTMQEAAENAAPGLVFDVQRVDRHQPAGMTGALLQTAPFYERGAPGPTLN